MIDAKALSTVKSWEPDSETNSLVCNVWSPDAVMHDKQGFSTPEVSVSEALVHPSIAPVSSVEDVCMCACVCMCEG